MAMAVQVPKRPLISLPPPCDDQFGGLLLFYVAHTMWSRGPLRPLGTLGFSVVAFAVRGVFTNPVTCPL